MSNITSKWRQYGKQLAWFIGIYMACTLGLLLFELASHWMLGLHH